MKLNWIIISILSAIIAGLITWLLTGSWKIALLCTGFVFIFVLINNPNRRYMKAFYVVLFPLLFNIYFTIQSKTENFDVEAGIRQLDAVTTFGLIAVALACLFLDYLERNGKLDGTLFSVKKNTVGNIKGDGNTINQTNV